MNYYKLKSLLLLTIGALTIIYTHATGNVTEMSHYAVKTQVDQDSQQVYIDKMSKSMKLEELENLWKTIKADKTQNTGDSSVLKAEYISQKVSLLSIKGRVDEGYALLQKAPRTILEPFTFAYQMVAIMSATTKQDWSLSSKAFEQRRLLYMKEIVLMEEKPEKQDIESYVKDLNEQMSRFDILLADAYEKLGKNDKAFFYAKNEIAKDRTNPQNNELYTRLLETRGDSVLLYTELENFMREGKYTPPMKDQLKRLHQAKKESVPFETYFAGLEGDHLEVLKNQLKAKLINDPLPPIDLLDMNGKAVSLSDLKGKIVVLDFWATWCVPCISSFPMMTKAREAFEQEKKNVVFLFVNTAERGTDLKSLQAKLNSFIKDKPYTLDMLIDLESKAGNKFHFESIPTKFIIDANGNIRYRATGFNANEKEAIEEMRTIIDLIS